jgi:hypothetical protein
MKSRALGAFLLALLATSCDRGRSPTGPGRPGELGAPVALTVRGLGPISDRFTAELWVQGSTAYTTTWGFRSRYGDAIYLWDLSGEQPQLADSVLVAGAGTLGDVQVSDDGALLAVAEEPSPNGALLLYDLADPRRPRLITRYATPHTRPGVHTAELARVDGKLYGFLSIDPTSGEAARLVIVDLTDPAHPAEVFSQVMGSPYVHDVFVRDGYLFTALWNDGLAIWDVGAEGGSPASPVRLSSVATAGGNVHNVWWYHDAETGEKRYAFVGEEQIVSGFNSAGDVHVVDVTDLRRPKEVAFFHVPDAAVNGATATFGTHNFSVDEERGILYAAYYNGGVRALDVRGDLGACDADARDALGRCDLSRMGREVGRGLADRSVYVWGVQRVGTDVYASDMLNGIWKLDAGGMVREMGR